MIDEKIVLYTRDEPNNPTPLGRTEYYDHAFDTYSNQYVCVVDILLFNRHGEVLLQKRGRQKRFNPGKLHTTVGGHINANEHADFSMVHECMEELGAPLLLFPKKEFEAAYQKLSPYSTRAALGYFVDDRFRDYRTDNALAHTKIKDRSYFYLGRYDGSFGSPDRDAAGYEWMDLAVFDDALKRSQEQFTDGLPIFIQTYRTEIDELVTRFTEQD